MLFFFMISCAGCKELQAEILKLREKIADLQHQLDEQRIYKLQPKPAQV